MMSKKQPVGNPLKTGPTAHNFSDELNLLNILKTYYYSSTANKSVGYNIHTTSECCTGGQIGLIEKMKKIGVFLLICILIL